MKTTKRSFLISLVALLVLLSMFVGTTFAWFTDIAVSSGNVIQAGRLDIALVKGTHTNNGWNWEDTNGEKIFNYDKWEPGYTTYAAIGIENRGNLAAKVTAKISLNGTPTILGDVIEVYAAVDFDSFDPSARPDFTDTNAWISLGTMADILSGRSAVLPERVLDPNMRARMIVALHMKEDAGNEYQGIDLGANFDITVMATQASFESDSFDNQYDVDSEWPYVAVKFHAPKSVADNLVVDPASNKTTLAAPVTLGDANGIKAEVNENVELEPGVETLTLKVESMETPTQDIDLQPGEVARSIDVHVDGVKEGNTTPMLITLPELFSAGLNEGNARIIHVEDGQPVEMTRVNSLADLDAHNEFYYNVNTGDVVVAMASFSEITPIENDYNPWNGKVNTSWYDANKTEFTLTTADQLAGFGAIVDGGYNDRKGTDKVDNWVSVTQDSFEKKTIKLGSDINMGAVDAEGNRISFNPIGYSYSYKGGQVFKGTFDGDGHTISNLYINGWDLGLSYSMAGGGFFASVEDATIQNVTFSKAEIAMECIEQGVVAGLAAGNCNFLNINIYGCSVANYQRATGGVVGEVNPHRDENGIVKEVVTHTFKDINIDSTTVIGSLWGDFDAPVGGVIGAKWDDDVNVDGQGVTQVVMENVKVACRLDVYNDVTSTYQWYAYRRAGMLIGNTEEVAADGRTAKADFLTCKLDENNNPTVTVYYGTWTDYHYCEFSEDYNSPSWPFVRVEAGENCNAYSNPRWGVATDANGNAITDAHTKENHTGDDECRVHLPFNQLYGGGQGVYGQPIHTGVTVKEYDYAIIYVNNSVILHTEYKTNESSQATANSKAENAAVQSMNAIDPDGDYKFDHWMNAGSTKIESVDKGNTSDVVLYPSFKNIYTVTYVDDQGNILHWETIHSGDKTTKITPDVPAIEGGYTGTWSITDFSKISSDVTVYPVYNADDGIVKLTPVDIEPKDGVVEYYQVTNVVENDSNVNIVIPGIFNKKPVIEVVGGAFAEFDNITTIRIPTSITTIGADAFANYEKKGGISGFFGALQYEQITFYYEGTYEQWNSINKDGNWDRYVGDGSHIFFKNVGDSGITYLKKEGTNGINAAWKSYSTDPTAVDVYDVTKWGNNSTN